MMYLVTAVGVLVAIAAPFVTTLRGERDGVGLVLPFALAIVATAAVALALDLLAGGLLEWAPVFIAMVAGVAGAAVNAKQ